MNKVEVFEDFLLEKYKYELYSILNEYPDKKSIVIDFHDLEKFNHDLADILIEKPEEIIGM